VGRRHGECWSVVRQLAATVFDTTMRGYRAPTQPTAKAPATPPAANPLPAALLRSSPPLLRALLRQPMSLLRSTAPRRIRN
jgi:hypothetical protein